MKINVIAFALLTPLLASNGAVMAQTEDPVDLTVIAECGVLRNTMFQPMRMGEVLDYFAREGEGQIDRRRAAHVTVYRSSALPDDAVVMRYSNASGDQHFDASGGLVRIQGRLMVQAMPRIDMASGEADTRFMFQRPSGIPTDRQLPAEAADEYYVNGRTPLYDRPFARQRYNFTGRCEVAGE